MSNRSKPTGRELLTAAAEALSDLNVFSIVESVVTNGHLHSPSHAASDRIIAICRREMDKRLRDYDAAARKLG